MTDAEEEANWARLDRLMESSWQVRCLQIEYEVQECRKQIRSLHYEVGSLGDAISDALQDLMVVSQAVQKQLSQGVVQQMTTDATLPYRYGTAVPPLNKPFTVTTTT